MADRHPSPLQYHTGKEKQAGSPSSAGNRWTARTDANRYTARPAFGWERRTGEVEALTVEGGRTINMQFFKGNF